MLPYNRNRKHVFPILTGQEGHALIVDGATLAYALRQRNRAAFLALASACTVVVCCRTTPLQKAQVVQLVKEGKKVRNLVFS